MTTLDIVRLGHPALRAPAAAVGRRQLATEATQRLIDDLVETMHAAGGVGLAAPQVGVSLQLFVYEVPEDQGAPAERPGPRTVVNPMLVAQHGELVYDWEGCLSIPELRGLVPRHPVLRLRALDRGGEAVDFVAEGFEARVLQHEYDHLNGVVFLDRMRDLRSLAYSDEWQRYLSDDDEAAPGVG